MSKQISKSAAFPKLIAGGAIVLFLLAALVIGKSSLKTGTDTRSKAANESTLPAAYISEGIAFYAAPAPKDGFVPVYRLFNPTNGQHFYTASADERDYDINQLGFHYDFIAFYAATASGNGFMPVYRLYNPSTSDRLFTVSSEERDGAVNNFGYKYEAVAFYAAAPTAVNGSTPVYRLASPQYGHFYTIDLNERDKALQANTCQTGSPVPSPNPSLSSYRQEGYLTPYGGCASIMGMACNNQDYNKSETIYIYKDTVAPQNLVGSVLADHDWDTKPGECGINQFTHTKHGFVYFFPQGTLTPGTHTLIVKVAMPGQSDTFYNLYPKDQTTPLTVTCN